MEYFRQEAVISATNLFNAAVNAIEAKPTLKKVIIMKQTPRYDPLDVDPLGLKPVLSLLFNNTLTDLWMVSPSKDKIFVGNHNIECSGAIKESRYRHTKTGKYDGLHLYGASGQKFFTLSVLNILQGAKVTTEDYDFHLSCPQFIHQSRRNRKTQKQQPNKKQVRSSVPTYNRFDSFLGNC